MLTNSVAIDFELLTVIDRRSYNQLSLQTPIYSLKRAMKLQGGKNDYSWHFGPRAWQRIKKKICRQEVKEVTIVEAILASSKMKGRRPKPTPSDQSIIG